MKFKDLNDFKKEKNNILLKKIKRNNKKDFKNIILKKPQKNRLINFLKTFNLYEITWLFSVVVITTLLMVFFPFLVLEPGATPFIVLCSVTAVIFNPVCELLISKQSKWNFIVSIVFIEITEMFVYFSLGYYSSAFFSLIFWVPIDIFSFINWFKHKDEKKKEVTKVKKLSWKQDILVIFGIIFFSITVGYALQFVGGEATYLDAFVSAVGMTNGILLFFRYNEQWYAWFIYLIFDAVLWILSGHYIMLITTLAMTINTVYGFIRWLKYIKLHKNKPVLSVKS